ncbi:related to polypeptide chain release factors [Lecanosticta acicola]|uniref:Related to polypeptide chain release factors n=1 Tax=Lecanosticta acicola TaxID=111012 RepID=A0AAI9E7A7_9PEZI|nr:related to polypeptide chain release factors [Lecanosticta acicola]
MFLLRAVDHAGSRASAQRLLRSFSTVRACLEKPLPPRIVIPESDITESFLKGTGPGGQKINKTSSAVQLKHLPTGIVVKSQETRSREQNRRTARRILAEKLEEIEKGPQSRTALKAAKASKKKASASKKARRKYRGLEEKKSAAGHEMEEGQGGVSGEVTDGSQADSNIGDESSISGSSRTS